MQSYQSILGIDRAKPKLVAQTWNEQLGFFFLGGVLFLLPYISPVSFGWFCFLMSL